MCYAGAVGRGRRHASEPPASEKRAAVGFLGCHVGRHAGRRGVLPPTANGPRAGAEAGVAGGPESLVTQSPPSKGAPITVMTSVASPTAQDAPVHFPPASHERGLATRVVCMTATEWFGAAAASPGSRYGLR